MKAIIIDDEQHCIKTLQWTLAQYCAEIRPQQEDDEQIVHFQPDLFPLASRRATAA